MELVIRPVELSDSVDIGKYLFTKSDEIEIREGLKIDIEKAKRGELLRIVACIDGKVIGQCDFRKPPSPLKQHIVEVTGLVVNENFQGQRISSGLLDYGANWARKNNIEIMTTSVRKGTKAENIYLHKGFNFYGELKNGIIDPWKENKIYDEAFLFKKL
ncbi:MAG TPA: GNAT family N-acetyltransferase [Spirochaetia bacterium]|nr:GNAT family N-acetyltransferase [Spirochaetia bacterium]